MKKVLSLCFAFLLFLSCNKKEEKKEDTHQELPIIEQQIPKETVVEQASEIEKETTSELIFTVQIAALRKDNKNLLSIDGIKTYEENTLTKYRIGSFKTYEEARAFRFQILDEYKEKMKNQLLY